MVERQADKPIASNPILGYGRTNLTLTFHLASSLPSLNNFHSGFYFPKNVSSSQIIIRDRGDIQVLTSGPLVCVPVVGTVCVPEVGTVWAVHRWTAARAGLCCAGILSASVHQKCWKAELLPARHLLKNSSPSRESDSHLRSRTNSTYIKLENFFNYPFKPLIAASGAEDFYGNHTWTRTQSEDLILIPTLKQT